MMEAPAENEISILERPPVRKVPTSTWVSGKLVIGLILVVAFLAAAYSWWFRWQATHRAAEFWGVEAIAVLQRPREVVAVQLGGLRPVENISSDASSEPLRGYHVSAERVITTSGGITHLRQALLEDRSYDWSKTFSGRGGPRYCLRMLAQHENRELILYFPSDFSWMGKAEIAVRDKNILPELFSNARISTAPIAAGLSTYFSDVFDDRSP